MSGWNLWRGSSCRSYLGVGQVESSTAAPKRHIEDNGRYAVAVTPRTLRTSLRVSMVTGKAGCFSLCLSFCRADHVGDRAVVSSMACLARPTPHRRSEKGSSPFAWPNQTVTERAVRKRRRRTPQRSARRSRPGKRYFVELPPSGLRKIAGQQQTHPQKGPLAPNRPCPAGSSHSARRQVCRGQRRRASFHGLVKDDSASIAIMPFHLAAPSTARTPIGTCGGMSCDGQAEQWRQRLRLTQ